jgi:hypothetical protein
MRGVDDFAYPFRFTPAGDVATVEDGSDLAAAQAIIILAGVAPGERPAVPAFGLADPTFGDGLVDVPGLNAQLALYGPDGVQVDAVDVTIGGDRRAAVTLSFTNSSAEQET